MRELVIFLIFLIYNILFSDILSLPAANIPENPPLQPSVILPDGRLFLIDYFKDIEVKWDKEEKKLKTNRPGWWIINFPLNEIKGFDKNLSEEDRYKIIFGKGKNEIKNWYLYETGKPFNVNFKPDSPAPIKIHPNPSIVVNNEKGDDSNLGTYDKPLKTISKAIEKAKPGDIIHVYPGIYREEIRIDRSGEKEKPIIIEGIRDLNGKMPVISGNDILPIKWEIYNKEMNIYKAEIEMKMTGPLIDENRNIILREVDRIGEMEPNTYLYNWSSKEFVELTEKFEEIIKNSIEIKEGDKFDGFEWRKVSVDKDGYIDFGSISNGKNSVFLGVSYVFCNEEIKGKVSVDGFFRGSRMTGSSFLSQSNRYHLWINDIFVKGTGIFSTYEKHFYLNPRHTPYWTKGGDIIESFVLKKGWNTLYFIWDTNTRPENLKFKFNFPKDKKPISSCKKEIDKEGENFITEYLILGPIKSKKEKAVYICLQKGENIENKKISLPVRGNPLVSIGILDEQRKINNPVKYIHFRGFEIIGGGHFQQRNSIKIYGSGNLIEGCLINKTEATGIGFSNREGIQAEPNIIRNNWILYPGCVGIGAQHTSEFLTEENQVDIAPGRGRTIAEYNYIKGANWLTLSYSWESGGMKMFRLTNCILRYNIIEDSPSQGIWFDTENYNNRVEGNLIKRCYFYGIGIEANPGPNLIVNNLIVDLKPIGHENVWFRYGILGWSSHQSLVINNTIDGKWEQTPCWQNQKGTDGILLCMNKKDVRTKWGNNFAPDTIMNNLILGCKNGVIKGEGDFIENNFYEKGYEMSFIKRYYPEKAKEENFEEKEFKIEDFIKREIGDYRIKKEGMPLSKSEKLLPHYKRYDFYGLLRFPEDDVVGAFRLWKEIKKGIVVEIDLYDGGMERKIFE
jgi:hypothetical protein